MSIKLREYKTTDYVFNVLVVLRNSEKSDSIMFYKNDMYKIS